MLSNRSAAKPLVSCRNEGIPQVDRTSTARSFTRPSRALLLDDDLGTAVHQLGEAGVAEALVTDGQQRPLGIVTREGILEAWRRVTS